MLTMTSPILAFTPHLVLYQQSFLFFQTFSPSYQQSCIFSSCFFPAYTQKILILIIPTTFRTEGIHLHRLTFMSSFRRQQVAQTLSEKPETLKVNTERCGNAIELTILRWHQVQTPHRATSQTAHTTDATDTSNTLRDTEPGGERRRGHGAETHRGQR